jgi:hypothetical protein
VASRASLRKQAEAEAFLRVQPQISALREAAAQAVVDRNSAISAAAAASHGIGRAINRAGPSIRRAYSGVSKDAASSGAMVDDVAKSLPAAGPVGAILSGAITRERAAGSQRQARSLAGALVELSDRRIEAAAGRAYQTSKALSQYAAERSKLSSRASDVAATQGAAAEASFGKLTQAEEDRQLRRDLQSQSLASQKLLTEERLASSEKVAGANRRSSDHRAALTRRQSKLGRIQTAKLQSQRLAAAGTTKKTATTTPGGAPKLTATEQKGRQSISLIQREYASGRPMHEVAADARKKGYPEPLIGAAADLHSKGYVSPENVRKLHALGYSVPKEWTGVTVRPHTRKRSR